MYIFLLVLNEKFPNLEANMRTNIEDMIARANNMYELFKRFANEIKTSAEKKWRDFLAKFMAAAV